MRALRITAYVLGILLAVAYLLNLGGGFVEIIPDNIPIFGNLDEAAFTGLLLWCIRGLSRERRKKLEATPAG